MADKHENHQLAPIYLISGDETLLVEEACQSIRNQAYKNNFTDREIFYADTKFDWNKLLASANNLSLFGDNSILELRLSSNKINEAGKKTLLNYATNPPQNKILLIVTKKLSGPTQNTKWYKTIKQAGKCLQIWPITSQQLPTWIAQRLKQQNISADADVINFLSENTEGNLLAAKQAIEKIALLYDNKSLTLQEAVAIVSDNSHFDIFALVDAALSGDVKRTTRILTGLKNEGIEPILILWALAREIRNLSSMAQQLQQGEQINNVLYKNHVWEKRKPLIRLGLKRLSLKKLLRLLQQAAKIDRIIKGAASGNVWDELRSLSIKLSR
jgi:DNA polymerase-3 subunit delta